MKTAFVPLGKTGIHISPVGLGTWQFSNGKGWAGKYWRTIPQDETKEIVKIALEGGVNWFDTAEIYGNGQSEHSLSLALSLNGKRPGEVIIATKWWPMFRTSASIGKTIDERLKQLNGFGIDLYQVHQPFGFSSVESEMKAMAALAGEGKIRSVGVSNFSASRMLRAYKALEKEGIPLASNQVKYSLLDRRIEKNGILQMARELGITIIAYSPLEQGILTGKFHTDPDSVKRRRFRKHMKSYREAGLEKSRPLIGLLEEIAKTHHTSVAAVALHWLIRFHGETVVAIPGASQPSHMEANLDAMRIELSREEMNRIDQVSSSVCRK